MSIADKITRLATAHDAIITALTDKGVTATGHGFEDFADDIGSISSGGGGFELLTTESLGQIEVTVTNGDQNLNKSIVLSDISDYDTLLVVSKKTVEEIGNISTIRFVWIRKQDDNVLYASLDGDTRTKQLKSGNIIAVDTQSPPKGVYPYTATLNSAKTVLTLGMAGRYHSSDTGEINGSYRVYVYGVNLMDVI